VATEVRVQVLGAADSDAHELAELMRRLKDDLRHVDADDVRHLPIDLVGPGVSLAGDDLLALLRLLVERRRAAA
jgi:hypothetical protein